MHMADALLAPVTAATMYVASGTTTGISLHHLKKDNQAQKLPMMGVMAAMVFAGQMINYTIPGTGSSGHLCGGMLLSAVLGPYAGFLSMVVILTLQCLLFADGGLMALGANAWNMAFYGCFIGYYLIYRPIAGRYLNKENSFVSGKQESDAKIKGRIVLASILGCVITLQLGAFSVCVETFCSGISALPFGAFLALMQPIHLAIGLVEGLITAAVLVFVYQARPEVLEGYGKNTDNTKVMSLKTLVFVLAMAVVLVGGIGSCFASSNPDGLEWSLFGNEEEGYSANMGLDEENYGIESALAETMGEIQEKTAILPDYAFANDSENVIGTSVSGIVGSALVALVAVAIYFVGRLSQKKKVV